LTGSGLCNPMGLMRKVVTCVMVNTNTSMNVNTQMIILMTMTNSIKVVRTVLKTTKAMIMKLSEGRPNHFVDGGRLNNRSIVAIGRNSLWLRVRSEEDWMRVFEESREKYESGGFLLARLGAERFLDPKLIATLLSLRQRLIAEWGRTTAADTMLVDLAVLHYYHAIRVQGWIGDLAIFTWTATARFRRFRWMAGA